MLYITSFLEIGLLVPGKILKGFYHICAWRPSWPSDKHHVNMFSFHCTFKLTYKIKFPKNPLCSLFPIEKPKLRNLIMP